MYYSTQIMLNDETNRCRIQVAKLKSSAVPLFIQKSADSAPLFKSTATTNAGIPGAPALMGK